MRAQARAPTAPSTHDRIPHRPCNASRAWALEIEEGESGERTLLKTSAWRTGLTCSNYLPELQNAMGLNPLSTLNPMHARRA